MTMKKATQEERFLKKIFEKGGESSIIELAKELGISDKSFAHTIQLLTRGGYIKKNESTVTITHRGIHFCTNE